MSTGTPRRRFLFAPETFNLGETSRGVEVARALARAGHDVRFMGYSRTYAPYIREAGFDLDLLAPEVDDALAAGFFAFEQGRSLRFPFTTHTVRTRVRNELDLIARWQPDAVIIGTTLTLLLSARIAGVPLVYLRPYPLSASHLASVSDLPLCVHTGPASRCINRLAGFLAGKLAKHLRWKPAAFRRVAREHGLRLPGRTAAMLDADLAPIVSLFPLLDGRPLVPGEVAVGPIYAHAAGNLPPEVEELAREHRRPLIHVGLGSSARREVALPLLTTLGDLDVDVVSTAGRYLTPRDRRGLPASVLVFDFLPAHQLGGLIDASLIHGGEGTVQTACASGVPFAGIGMQMEQKLNIEECVDFGNALAFTMRDIRRHRIPFLVERLLTDATLRRRARELAALMQGTDGARRSAEVILRFLDDRQ